MQKLGVLVLLGAVVGLFGWIMVASGLVDRPWVNAYKLTIHLSLALVVYSYTLWLALVQTSTSRAYASWRPFIKVFMIVLWVQLILGGIMSGTRSALVYPTWPDMHEEYIPSDLLDLSNYTIDRFAAYDKGRFVPAFFHFLHRGTAYFLLIIGAFWLISRRKEQRGGLIKSIFGFTLAAQVLLGIFTVLYSIGKIPVTLGVLHQAFAILLLSIGWIIYYHSSETQPGTK